jgi:rRNA-processing protein FCF1
LIEIKFLLLHQIFARLKQYSKDLIFKHEIICNNINPKHKQNHFTTKFMNQVIEPEVPEIDLKGAQLRIFQELKNFGFEKQARDLLALGFARLSQIRRSLVKNDGDLELAKADITERNSRSKRNHIAEFDENGNPLKVRKERKERKEKKERQPREQKEKKVRKPRELKEKKERKPREPKESKPKVQCVEYEEVPSHIERVYLDGNNMLFVESSIRSLTLHRKRKEAEHIISDIALKYAVKCQAFDTTLVYDNSSWSLENKIGSVDQIHHSFNVLSAGPKYDSSDDALVDWAKNLGEAVAKNSLFVTSDRELQRRLQSAGVSDIMKPGRWFKMVRLSIGDSEYDGLLPKKEEKKEEKKEIKEVVIE